MTQHEALLNRGTKKQRQPEPAGSGGGRAWCDACREPVRRFWSHALTGAVWQDCGCGSVRMRPHVEMPIEIPPPDATPRRASWGWSDCAWCGARYQRSPRNETNGCSRRCQWRLREPQRVRPAPRRCSACRRGRAGPDGRCVRCRVMERYRARRLAKLAVA